MSLSSLCSASDTWQSMLANFCEAYALVDHRAHVLAANERTSEILGVEPHHLLGQRLTTVFASSRILECLAQRRPLLSGSRSPNGLEYLILYLPLPGVNEGAIVFWLPWDNRIVQEANQHAELWRTLAVNWATNEETGLFIVDTNGIIIGANSQACHLVTRDERDLCGMALNHIIPRNCLLSLMAKGKGDTIWRWRFHGHDLEVREAVLAPNGNVLGGFVLLRSERSARLRSDPRSVGLAEDPFAQMVGESPLISALKTQARKVARGDATLLITGESGTGKELLARAIHLSGPRRSRPFIKVNCAAIPENLLESEFFGYEEGAFTGAARGGRSGKFEAANGGTILLDEIGDMSPALQAKLLRVLQERTFERIGGNRSITVDVRIIAATNRNLEERIQEGLFRPDLYYRLAVITLNLPPLVDRAVDIPALAQSISTQTARRHSREPAIITPEVMNILQTYPWPGNVHQLENVMEYAYTFLEPDEATITATHLPPMLQEFLPIRAPLPPAPVLDEDLTLEETLARAEQEAIRHALVQSEGNKLEAARILGVHRSCLYQKLRKYGIEG